MAPNLLDKYNFDLFWKRNKDDKWNYSTINLIDVFASAMEVIGDKDPNDFNAFWKSVLAVLVSSLQEDLEIDKNTLIVANEDSLLEKFRNFCREVDNLKD